MIAEYTYELGGRSQFLYVDENFDDSKFPEWIHKIIDSAKKIEHHRNVTAKVSAEEKDFLAANGYLEIVRFEKESGGSLIDLPNSARQVPDTEKVKKQTNEQTLKKGARNGL